MYFTSKQKLLHLHTHLYTLERGFSTKIKSKADIKQQGKKLPKRILDLIFYFYIDLSFSGNQFMLHKINVHVHHQTMNWQALFRLMIPSHRARSKLLFRYRKTSQQKESWILQKRRLPFLSIPPPLLSGDGEASISEIYTTSKLW